MDLLCLTIIGIRLQERSSVKQHTLDEPWLQDKPLDLTGQEAESTIQVYPSFLPLLPPFTAPEAPGDELSDAVSLHVGDQLWFSDVIDWARSLCRVAMIETSNGSSVRYEEFSGMMTINLFTKQSTAW